MPACAVAALDTSVVSDLNSSRGSRSSPTDDALDERLFSIKTRSDHRVKVHNIQDSFHQNIASNNSQMHAHQNYAPRQAWKAPAVSLQTPVHWDANSFIHTDEDNQALIDTIAILDVADHMKAGLLKNRSTSDLGSTISVGSTQRKFPRRRSGSLDSHGSGSTDSILNEAEEQIRMTSSGLILPDSGLSTGNLPSPICL